MPDDLQQDTAGAVAAYLGQQQEPARAAQASMSLAVDTNPDFEAELRRVSARTGVPLESARAYPEDVKRQAAVAEHDYADLAARFPTTTKFLADPDNARLAHDDVQNLSSTEATVGPIVGPKPSFWNVASGLLKSLPVGADMARQGIRMQLADLFGFKAVGDDARSKYGQLSFEQQIETPAFQSSTAQAVYGGATSTVRAVPGLLASLATRSPTPMLATIGLQTEADAYGKYRSRGATPGQALLGGAAEGAVEVGTELLPMSFLVNNLGKTGAGHFLTGLLAREVPGEQIATLAQDAIDTAIANPDKTWAQYAAERPEAAYQTLVATVTQAALMESGNAGLARVHGRTQEAQRAVDVGAALGQLNDLAAASKLRERDASTAQAFFQSLMQEGRDTVWITPKALAESGMLEHVAQALPGVAAQLNQAATTNADIRIPVADLMANMAGPELAQSIIPHLSDEPGGFTQTTAAEYLQSGAGKELADEVARALTTKQADDAFTASRQKVEAGFLDQLNRIDRFAPEVNQAYAAMISNFFAVQAARLGVTPEEIAQRYPLEIQAERLVGPRTLDQGATGLETVRQAWDAAGIDHFISERKGVITLAKIVVPANEREDGRGTAALQQLVAYADQTGQKIALTPSADFGGSKKRLVEFYKRFGFVENKGKNADHEIGESMYRPASTVLNQPRDTRTEPDAPRGSIALAEDITEAPSIITLLRGADLSTFLHESGHFFLEVMSDISNRPDAPQEVKDDMAKTLAWFGVPDLATWNTMEMEEKRPLHEQFARGFEAYLFEGSAPVAELRGVFARFRSWLVNVYRTLTALDVELTPEVRGVFGRMLASTEAISQAEHEAGLAGMFGTKPEFMTEEEWTAYRTLSIGATEKATRDLEARALHDMKWLSNAKAKELARLQRDAAAKRKAIRDEVGAEVMAKPINVARRFLTHGELPDADRNRTQRRILEDAGLNGTKLNLDALKEMYGEGSAAPWRYLPTGKRGLVTAEGGLMPDVVAELFGFDSGDQLVRELLAAEKPADEISRLTDQRMLERHGDLVDEQALARAVDEAVYSNAHARFIATEMNALAKAAGKPAVLAKAAKMYAEQIVARTPVNQLRPDQFTRAAARAGKAADAAFKKGDIQTAAAEKQTQLINTYAAKAALDARSDVEKIMDRFGAITRGSNEKVSKTRDLDVVMATRAILAEFGIGTRGKKASEYLASVEAYDPGMAAVLRERIDASTENAKPYQELTIEQMRGLRDEIESMWYLARRSRQMEVDGDLMDRQDIQDALRARLEEIGVPDTVPGDGRAITPGEVNLSKLQSLRAALRRVEAWADAKDGAGTKMGPFRRFIWNTIKDPADAYRVDKAKYLKKLRDLLAPIAPTLKQVKIDAPELGYTFGFDKGGMGKVELLHAILHTGNAGNKKKLLLGRNWADVLPNGEMDTSRWDAFVDRMINQGVLTKADFDFAQGVWDLLEEMKPLAQKAHREAFGRYFDEVTADAFDTPFGKYRGGYVPAIADSRIVADAKTRSIMEEENATLMNALPSTTKGFTKARVEYNRPLLLDLRTLAQHIDKVLLFAHLEMPVRDVRRILGHSSVATPLHRIDPAAYDGLLTPWLNRAARQQVETQVSGSNGLMRFFSVVRSRAGMAAMFANISNTAQQITGFSIAALRVKPSHLASAAVDFIRSPRAMADAVAEASPYMANRMENEVGAMTDAINEILLNPSVYQKAVAWTQKHTYFLQSAVDNVMGPIIWHGAYNQAIEEAPAGMSEDEVKTYARRLADSAVRETQGSTLPEDISRIETGNAFVRMFTQFAGYFNMQANILGTEFAKVAQDTGLRKGAGRGLYILLFGFFAPAWVAQAIALAFRGGPDDDDKDGSYLDDWIAQTFGWGTLRAGTALVPVAGQTINALANSFNGKPYDDRISTSPAISMIESAVSVPADVYKLATGTGSKTKTVRDVASLISLTVGVPASAAARPAAYLTDVATGKARPTGPVDVTRGVVTGAASPASKGR
jgi:GNAT superfamily N-acetyltransferase